MCAAPSFDVSVVLPLSHDHGFNEAGIDGWNGQSHPRERIQLAAVVEADESRQPPRGRRARSGPARAQAAGHPHRAGEMSELHESEAAGTVAGSAR